MRRRTAEHRLATELLRTHYAVHTTLAGARAQADQITATPEILRSDVAIQRHEAQ